MMIHYKSKSGEVYAYDQEQIDGGWVKKGLVKMTVAEVAAHLNPPPTADSERATRDSLLQQLDTIVSNPLRFAELTLEQQSELAEYRQFLLDVPQQEGFPLAVDWPVMPAV